MEEKLSTKLIKIFIFLFVLGGNLLFLYDLFEDFNWTFESLLQIMLEGSFLIVTILFLVGFAIYNLILSIVKKKIVCRLEHIMDLRKVDDPYSFELQFAYRGKIFAYNIKEDTHSYVIGKNYNVEMRNNKILNVLSSTDQKVNNKENYWRSTYLPGGSFVPYNLVIMFYFFDTMFLINIIVILINIFINKLAGKELNNNLKSLGIFFILLIIFAWWIYNDYRKKKERENYNEEEF